MGIVEGRVFFQISLKDFWKVLDESPCGEDPDGHLIGQCLLYLELIAERCARIKRELPCIGRVVKVILVVAPKISEPAHVIH